MRVSHTSTTGQFRDDPLQLLNVDVNVQMYICIQTGQMPHTHIDKKKHTYTTPHRAYRCIVPEVLRRIALHTGGFYHGSMVGMGDGRGKGKCPSAVRSMDVTYCIHFKYYILRTVVTTQHRVHTPYSTGVKFIRSICTLRSIIDIEGMLGIYSRGNYSMVSLCRGYVLLYYSVRKDVYLN